MIAFHRFHIDHFANYVNTTIEFSATEDRPLTFLRGHNGAGKTTLLRAMIWTMYGMDALPRFDHDTHALRPDFRPDDEELTTTGAMCFAMTGRENPADDSSAMTTFYYRLTRTLSHKFNNGRLIQTEGERVTLERSRTSDWDDDIKWEDRSVSIDQLARQYFTRELRDLIFLDADKVESDLMGEEGQEDRSEEINSINSVVKSVLGVAKVEAAHDRTVTAAAEFHKALDKLSNKNDAITTLRQEERDLEASIEQTERELGALLVGLAETEQNIKSVEAEKAAFAAAQNETAALQEEVSEEQEQVRDEEQRLSGELKRLAESLFSAECLVGLVADELSEAESSLEALKQDKGLPRAEVGLLQRLIQSAETHDHGSGDPPSCICSNPISETELKVLRLLLKDSKDRHAQETALTKILDWLIPVTSTLQADPYGGYVGPGGTLSGIAEAHTAVVATKHSIRELRDRIRTLAGSYEEYQRLEMRQNGLENSKGQLQAQIREKKRRLGVQYVLRDGAAVRLDSVPHDSLTGEERGLEPHPPEVTAVSLITRHKNKVRERQEAERATGGLGVERARVETSDKVTELLDRAAKLLLSQNTPEIDKAVRETYGRIIGFNDDSDTSDVGFGVNNHGDHDLWMKNPRGGLKAIGAANGASRRALVTSFVLALLDTAGTIVPFVSDSLLNAASGEMKSRLLREVVTGYGQPIMFGFRDDLSNPQDRKFVAENAEHTYSISHAAQTGSELANRPEGKTESRSVICICNPTMYCHQCEHPSDATNTTMQRHPSPQTVN